MSTHGNLWAAEDYCAAEVALVVEAVSGEETAVMIAGAMMTVRVDVDVRPD
jgi:hypothetical protein